MANLLAVSVRCFGMSRGNRFQRVKVHALLDYAETLAEKDEDLRLKSEGFSATDQSAQKFKVDGCETQRCGPSRAQFSIYQTYKGPKATNSSILLFIFPNDFS